MRLLARALLPALLLLPGLARAATESLSQLPAAATVNLGDIVPCTQGSTGPGSGTTRKCAVQQVGTALGLGQSGVAGTLAQQNSSAVAITGGTASGVTVSLGDLSGANVTAAGGTTVRTLAARAADVANVLDFGAKADATGTAGVGTDDTAAFQAALGTANRRVVIPAGQYRITGPITLASGVTLECAGRNSTSIQMDDPTGTANFFTVTGGASQIVVRGCGFYRLQPATAGAVLYATNTYYLFLEDNRFGYSGNTNIWDAVKVDCSGGGANSLYFKNNQIQGEANDGVNLSCVNPANGATIADVFFEGRNYIRNTTHAAIEMEGHASWAHIDNVDFDQNTGYGLLANGANAGGTGAAVLSLNGNHFEGNATDASVSNFSWVLNWGNEYISTTAGAGFSCTACTGVTGGHNLYVAAAGLTLNGVSGYTDAGSHFAATSGSRTGIVQIGPSGTTASNSISITGADYPFSTSPFLAFTGSAYPATSIALSVNAVQGSCWTGTNVAMASFAYDCKGKAGDAASHTAVSDLALTTANPAIFGNVYYAGGWKFYNNGSGGTIAFGASSGNLPLSFSVTSSVNSGGSGAAASIVSAGGIGTDGSLLWDGTTAACGKNCGSFGSLRLNTTAAQPACNSTTRGTFWVVQAASGTKDSVSVCAKDATDAYAWRTIY